MSDAEILFKIANEFVDFNYDDLTTLEKGIIRILKEEKKWDFQKNKHGDIIKVIVPE